MKKISLAVCIGDEEYRNRLEGCMMKHYRDRLELYIFEEPEQLMESEKRFDLWILSDHEEILREDIPIPTLYLCEEEHMMEKRNVRFTGKYQGVNQIVDLLMGMVPEETCTFSGPWGENPGLRIAAVYALSESEYQLPFSLTLGAILSEYTRPLLVDLQENSGITRLTEDENEFNLEDLLVMMGNETCSKKRLSACIGHGKNVDYVYPAENAESICEADCDTYMRMLAMLGRELGYQEIILNMGSRFPGFVDLLGLCSSIYLLRRDNGLSRWREQEFLQELSRRSCLELQDRIKKIDLPFISSSALSFERLVEQWKWNEMGDLIRKMLPEAVSHGRAV